MLFSVVFFALSTGCSSDLRSMPKPLPKESENPDPDPDPGETITLRMVDMDATKETKALYSWLWKLPETGFMFGHHDDLWYGHDWMYTEGGSDTRAVCGDYPAVFSMDFASMMDSRHQLEGEIKDNEHRIRVIKEAYSRGEVITGCLHINNPLTERPNGSWDSYPEGTSWDNTKVVNQILDRDSEMNAKFLLWLDRLADVALSLKGEGGELIPVIIRPFHEHTQAWSWWGSQACSDAEFISLWRMTIDYLKDEKGVHNFIYAISPQMDGMEEQSRLLYRWPGDEYVDFLGMDCYHGLGFANFKHNINSLETISLDKKIPCGVTETGQEGFTMVDYWSRGIVEPLENKRVSMVVMWRNEYGSANHYFSVFPGHPSEDDFKLMYANPKAIFSSKLPEIYSDFAPGVTVE